MKSYYIFAGVLVVISLTLVAFAIDNPFLVKDRKADAVTLNEFDSIKYDINSYYTKNKTLPTTLQTLNGNYKSTYEYTVKSATVYQLCATFLTKATITPTPAGYLDYEYNNETSSMSKPHEKGHDCIEYTLSTSTIQSAKPTITPVATNTPAQTGPTDLAILDYYVNDSTISVGKGLIFIPVIKNLGTSKATFNTKYYIDGAFSSGGNGYILDPGEVLDPRIASYGFSYPYQKDIVGEDTQLKLTIDYSADTNPANNSASFTFTNSKTATPQTTCSSPNGTTEGFDYFNKGSITSVGKTYTDYCIDNTVMEFACSKNVMRLFSNKCTYGCNDGQCIKAN